MMDWVDEVAELLFRCSFMTVATADLDGHPWVSPVEFVCDEDMQIYWISLFDSRHSRNVQVNPRAAITVYDSSYVPLSEEAQGLYGEGEVEEFQRSEIEPILPALTRWIAWRDAGRTVPRRPTTNRFESNSPWRYYRLVRPRFFALNPDGHPDYGWPAPQRVPVDLRQSFRKAYQAQLE